MAIRALMVDVDGVVVVQPEPHGWSTHLERDLGLSPSRLQAAFFAPHFGDIVHGRATLRDRLAPVLAQIAPHLSAETLIDYWFEQDSHLDHGLLAQIDQLRAAGLRAHLATVQEHERANYLWTRLALKDHSRPSTTRRTWAAPSRIRTSTPRSRRDAALRPRSCSSSTTSQPTSRRRGPAAGTPRPGPAKRPSSR